jgi:hypothetical protein
MPQSGEALNSLIGGHLRAKSHEDARQCLRLQSTFDSSMLAPSEKFPASQNGLGAALAMPRFCFSEGGSADTLHATPSNSGRTTKGIAFFIVLLTFVFRPIVQSQMRNRASANLR